MLTRLNSYSSRISVHRRFHTFMISSLRIPVALKTIMSIHPYRHSTNMGEEMYVESGTAPAQCEHDIRRSDGFTRANLCTNDSQLFLSHERVGGGKNATHRRWQRYPSVPIRAFSLSFASQSTSLLHICTLILTDSTYLFITSRTSLYIEAEMRFTPPRRARRRMSPLVTPRTLSRKILLFMYQSTKNYVDGFMQVFLPMPHRGLTLSTAEGFASCWSFAFCMSFACGADNIGPGMCRRHS